MNKPAQHADDHCRPGVLIIGLGNLVRGDDGAGILAARLLRERLRGVEVIEVHGDCASLVDLWKTGSTVLVIDAVRSQCPPGTIVRIDASTQRLPETWSLASTHSVGLREAIELARALGCLPERLIVYGIEGTQFAEGAGLSPQVEQALFSLVETIVDDIKEMKLQRLRAEKRMKFLEWWKERSDLTHSS